MSSVEPLEYTQAIQLLCLLRQLGQAHSTSSNQIPPDHDVQQDDDDDDDDSASVSSLDVVPDIEGPHSQTHAGKQRQSLLDALSFVASVDCTTHSVAAMTMELVNNGNGVCFRVAMNGKVPAVVMEKLDRLGHLLMKTATKGLPGASDDLPERAAKAEDEVFNHVVQMKQPRLTTDFGGKSGGRQGLLTVLTNAEKELTPVLGTEPTFPGFAPHLQLSAEELSQHGPYTQDTHQMYMESSWTRFQKLLQLVRKTCRAGKGRKAKSKFDLDTAKEVILLTYELRSSRVLEYLLSQGRQGVSSKAMGAIRKLSRYWQCCLELVRCARSMAALRQIQFADVPKFEARPVKSGATEDILTNIHFLLTSAGYSVADLRSYCRETGLREADLRSGVWRSLRIAPYVHAEIKLVYYYALHPHLMPEVEIGCSKHACFACYSFIKHHSLFKIAKTHSKVYPGWGLPKHSPISNTAAFQALESGIVPAFMQDLRQALNNVISAVPLLKPLQLPTDSSSGVTTTDNESVRSSDAVGRKPKVMEGERVSMTTKELVEEMRSFALGLEGVSTEEDEAQEGLSSTGVNRVPTPKLRPDTVKEGYCNYCNDVTTSRKCSKCRSVFFCSTECERAAEESYHIQCAPGRPIDSADYLVRYCLRDLLPDDDLVEGFGFDRCKGAKERSNLLGLYQGMLKGVGYGEVTRTQFRKWKQENSLAENICRYYDQIPRTHVGGYYPWFEKNKHIVDANTPKPSLLDACFNMNALRTWMPKLKGVMDIDSLRARLTEKELYVAVLYGGLKASYRPHPKMRLWMDFGFCTCRLEDGFQREEAELGDLYMQLFDNCTSTEFLRAFTDETLEQLAKRKGFSAKINELGRREIYLQPKPYSVYNLKQFIAVGDFGRDPTLAVQWDYGYLRCRNAGERMQWTETYKKVFQSHEHRDLQLHQACIKGKIFEYVKRISPDTPKSFESLCRNAYPLKEH